MNAIAPKDLYICNPYIIVEHGSMGKGLVG